MDAQSDMSRQGKMTKIIAKQALTPHGWVENVCVEIARNGTIASVTTHGDEMPDTVDILLPAPANAHSHSFQRAIAGKTETRGPDPKDSFWTWRAQMFRFLQNLTPDHVEAIAAMVQMEMLEAGYATNVEFHYLHHQVDGTPYDNLAEMAERIGAAAAQTGIGLTLLPVHYQYANSNGDALGPGQIRFGTDMDMFSRLMAQSENALNALPEDCRLGVAGHSLRAISLESLHALPALGKDGPVHLHLAEQIAEVEEIKTRYGKRPVELLLERDLLGPQWSLIHCTQMQPEETLGLAASGAIAVLCPITEANLGDGIFDAVRYLNAGGKIALGSDSNVLITLAEEMRQLDYSQRLRDHSRAALASDEKSTGRRVFDAICAGGARAAGRNCGVIEKGALADLIMLDGDHIDLANAKGDQALDHYIFAGSDRMIKDVWSAGRHVVRQGRHIARKKIIRQYRQTMTDLAQN
jgi:formimidoylglutamate deiminase